MALSSAPNGENSAIWQVQTSANSGARLAATPVAEVIYFNPSSVQTTGGYVFQTEFNIRNSIPENETVAGDNNEIQDMGLSGADVQLTGWFDNADANTNATLLMTWMKEAKTATLFTTGRFGLELEDFGEFDCVPTATYGYMIGDIKLVRDGEDTDKIGFVITLRFSGDLINGLGT